MEQKLTHLDELGRARMVDVGDKDITRRTAVAGGRIYMDPSVLEAVRQDSVPKGDVMAAARIAGIMAAKRTWELIPLCHVVALERCAVEFFFPEGEACIEARCETGARGKTGVEMEALSGVQTALLTIYDMCKALDRSMVMTQICLLKKEGGKSGLYERKRDRDD